MIKWFFLIVSGMVVLNFSASAQESGNLLAVNNNVKSNQADVRGFYWGLPSSIIKQGEKSIFAQEDPDGTLYYFDNDVLGMKTSITYEFADDKLFRVRTFSENIYSTPQDRIDDLIKIKTDLVSRYGEPIEEKILWGDDKTEKNYPENWGWAVYGGNLQIKLKWQTNRTIATAFLGSYEPFKPVLSVTYEDAMAKKLILDEEEKNNLKALP